MYTQDQNYNQNVTLAFQAEDNLTQVVDKVNERIGALQMKLAIANFGLDTMGKNFIKNEVAVTKFNATLKITDQLSQRLVAGLGAAKIFTIFKKGADDARNALSGLNDGVKAMNASGFNSGIIDQFTQLNDAIAGSSSALENFGLTAISQFNQYNKALTEVKTLFKENDEFVVNLSGNIQKLVNGELKNAITSIQALSASYEAASSGFTEAADNQAVMVAGLKLAKGGGADTGATMKVLAQTISAYNMAASDATKVAAVLNQTVLQGVTTIPELSNGFAQAAVTANAAKIKLEELGASVAALTLQGFNTPGALTGLEALFRIIINKTPQAEAALRELRDEGGKPIKFDINEIRTKGFANALNDLNKAAKGNAAVLAEIIPEATAYNTALALMSNNAEKLKSFSTSMFEVTKTGKLATEALDNVFGIKLKNQAEKFEAIVNRVTESFIQFGESLAPVFDEGVKALENLTKIITSIPDWQKRAIVQWLAAQMAISKVNDVIGILTGTVLKAFGAYMSWRATVLFMNGKLLEQVQIVGGLIKTNAGILPVLKQIIGIDQSRLLITSELNIVTANRTELVKKLWKGEGDRFTTIKQILGLDKEHILVTKELNNTIEGRQKIIENQLKQDKGVIEATKGLTALQEQRNQLNKDSFSIAERQSKLIEKEVADKRNLKQAEEQLQKAIGNKDFKQAYEVRQQILDLQQQQSINTNEQIKLQDEYKTKEKEQADLANKIATEEGKVTEARTAAKNKLLANTRENLKVQGLEAEAADLNNKASQMSARAERLRSAAKYDSAKASVLIERAEKAEAAAKAFSTQAQQRNNAAQALNITLKRQAEAAAIKQAIAEGKLMEVQTLAGKVTMKNNLLNNLFFKEMKISGDGAKNAIANISKFDFGKLLAPLMSGFSKIGGLLANISTRLAAFAPKLAVLSQAALPLIVAAGIIHDQFFGTTAQLRQMEESMKKINEEQKESTIKALEKLGVEKKLNFESRKRLLDLKAEVEELDEYKGIGYEIGEAFKSILPTAKALLSASFPILRVYYEVGKIIGKITNEAKKKLDEFVGMIRLDQMVGTFNEIDKAVRATDTSIVNLIKSTKQMKEGFSGLKDIDKLIKSATILDATQIQTIKNTIETNNKQIDTEISSNEKRIETLNKQLEHYDNLKEVEKKNASEGDRRLASERDKLAARAEELKTKKSQNEQELKDYVEYLQQRNQLLKRVQDNDLTVNPKDKQNTTTKEDVEGAVNAIQVKLRKGLRLSEKDLKEYSKKVAAIMNGTGEYITEVDGKMKTVKIDTSELTQVLNEFDSKAAGVFDGIAQQYEAGYIKGKDAAERIINELEKTVEGSQKKMNQALDAGYVIQQYQQAIKFAQEGSKEVVELLNTEAEIMRANSEAGVISSRKANEEIRKIQRQTLEEQIRSQEEQLKLLANILPPAMKKQMEAQLFLLQNQYNASLIDGQKKSIEEQFKAQQDGVSKQIALAQLLRDRRVTSEIEAVEKIDGLRKKQLQLQQQELEKQLQFVKNDVEKKIQLETQILGVKSEIAKQELDAEQRKIDNKYKLQQASITKEIALLQYQKEAATIGEEEAVNRLAAFQKRQIQSQEAQLREQLKLAGQDKEKRLAIEAEIFGKQADYQRLLTAEIEREHAKRIKLIQNQTEATKLGYQKSIQTLSSTADLIQEEVKLYEARNKAVLALNDIESGKVANQLRITADLQKRADLELKSVELQEKNREIAAKQERQSLVYQQKLLDLGFQRQQLELNIRKLENESSRKLLELEIKKAEQFKVRKEELESLQLKLQANKQEAVGIEATNKLLDKQRQNQQEINKYAFEEMESRQAIAREGGLIDLQLAKQNQILAAYEKQAQQANIQAQLAEISGNKQLLQQELLTKQYEMRTTILQKQQELMQSEQDDIKRKFQMAQDLAATDYQKQKLAKLAAKQELLTLNSRQKIEKDILEMQIKSNRIALERQKIEQAVAKMKLAAEVKVQEAETKKVLADKTKTDEEKEASKAQLEAKKFEYSSKGMEDMFLQQKEGLLNYEEKMQRYQLARKQGNERQDAEIGYAKTMFGRGAQDNIYRAIKEGMKDMLDGLEDTEMNTSKEYYKGVFNPNIIQPVFEQFMNTMLEKMPVVNSTQTIANGVVAPNLKKAREIKTQQITSSPKSNEPIVVNFTNTNTITVNGTDGTKDFEKKLMDSSVMTTKKLTDVLRSLNTELGK
ncbi:phage tail tape measure protein [Scytonema sp. NUACC26]|uniref:phage tail tape measure protein n=1 Tax=Scytonema sp. NUACC26 TaxID=3140176 RepID=UPI0034DBE64E